MKTADGHGKTSKASSPGNRAARSVTPASARTADAVAPVEAPPAPVAEPSAPPGGSELDADRLIVAVIAGATATRSRSRLGPMMRRLLAVASAPARCREWAPIAARGAPPRPAPEENLTGVSYRGMIRGRRSRPKPTRRAREDGPAAEARCRAARDARWRARGARRCPAAGEARRCAPRIACGLRAAAGAAGAAAITRSGRKRPPPEA